MLSGLGSALVALAACSNNGGALGPDAATDQPLPDAPVADLAIDPPAPDTAAGAEAPLPDTAIPDAPVASDLPADAPVARDLPAKEAPAPMETGPGGPEPDWLWRTPLPQGDDIVRLFVRDGAIYAFTSSFTLWRSTDEGSTWSVWSSVSTQLSNDFPGWARDAYVGPDGTFWLVGEYHSMAKSSDGGRFFKRIFPGITNYGNLATVLALSDQIVFTGGNDLGLLRSTDGGSTFTSVVTSSMYSGPSALWSDGTVILLGTSDGGVLRSTDGGLTFVNRGGIRSATVRAFAALGHERFAATSAGLLLSADDGDTWTAVTNDGGTPPSLWGVVAAEDGVWAVGQQGVVLFRRQGDTAFASVAGAGTNDFIAAVATPGGAALIYGIDGQLLRGSAGVLAPVASPSKYVVLDLVWTSPGHLAATTSTGKLLRSSDGAKTFTLTAPAADNISLTGIAAGAPNELYLSGSKATLLRSTDGGDSFAPLPKPTISGGSDAGKIWANGEGRVFLRETGTDTIHASTDHGQTWSPRHLSDVSGASRGGIWADGNGLVWASASDGIYESTDWGRTWSFITGNTGNVFGVWATSPQDIYYVAEGPSVGYSHDGGKTWSSIVGFAGSANYGNMTGIWANGPDAIYVTGGRGVVERSNDRGATWIREATTTGSTIYAIAGSPAGELAIASSHGGILLHR